MAHFEVNKNRIDLFFEDKPSEEIIHKLKLGKWKWYVLNLCWYNFDSQENRAQAKQFCSMYNSDFANLRSAESYNSNDNNKYNCRCPFDGKTIEYERTVTLKSKERTIRGKVYGCGVCGRKSIDFNTQVTNAIIKVGKYKYFNITSKMANNKNWINTDGVKEMTPENDAAYVYFSTNDIPMMCPKCNCESALLYKVKIGNKIRRNVRRCPLCGVNYMNYEHYIENTKLYNPVNDVESIREKKKREQELKKSAEDTFKIKKVSNVASPLKEAQTGDNKVDLVYEKKRGIIRYDVSKLKKQIKYGDIDKIDVRDFVIKRNTFRCIDFNHKLSNINALIKVIEPDGNIIEKRITAGFCDNCKTYYILNSVYEELKRTGTILCRISDDSVYLQNSKSGNIYNMELSEESFLKQYGYTVSKGSAITDESRQNLLAQLLEYGVYTKSDIISYLDFFISMREKQSRFDDAVAKWEKDRAFVASYIVSGMRNVIVNSISRK